MTSFGSAFGAQLQKSLIEGSMQEKSANSNDF